MIAPDRYLSDHLSEEGLELAISIQERSDAARLPRIVRQDTRLWQYEMLATLSVRSEVEA